MKTLRIPLLFAALVAALLTTAASAQTFSVTYNFGTKAGEPAAPEYGPLAQGRDGNIYGTAASGSVDGRGGVFKLTPAGKLTVLYSFTGGSDGDIPLGGLTLGTDGNFYGTTMQGALPASGQYSRSPPAAY